MFVGLMQEYQTGQRLFYGENLNQLSRPDFIDN
jgi:hypothetical protein